MRKLMIILLLSTSLLTGCIFETVDLTPEELAQLEQEMNDQSESEADVSGEVKGDNEDGSMNESNEDATEESGINRENTGEEENVNKESTNEEGNLDKESIDGNSNNNNENTDEEDNIDKENTDDKSGTEVESIEENNSQTVSAGDDSREKNDENNVDALNIENGDSKSHALIYVIDEAINKNDLTKAVALNTEGFTYYRNGDYEKALSIFKESIENYNDYTYSNFNYACTLGVLMKEDYEVWSQYKEEVIKRLKKVLELDGSYIGKIKTDSDLELIRDEEGYLELLGN